MKHLAGKTHQLPGNRQSLQTYQASHFSYRMEGSVALVTLNRPERKNPLTFDSYAELRDLFRNLLYASDVRAVVISGEGGNFCSGVTCTTSSAR
jgi:enoyl-CoA hydratase/carnithine racemase